ncbi:hypothetical protein BD779DRAFT_659855 [Infundibulicybe gibba]|nr:hypothetical protein BD779DRAFT_659855 [Infundibulicybe gibba]
MVFGVDPWERRKISNQALRVLPLDVIMVLHSYLLNPVWFWEDCSRVPKLAGLGYHAGLLGSLLETPEILTAPPDYSEIRQWVTMTSTPFDYLGSAAVLKTRTIDCPKCSGKVEVAFTTAGGTGYLQEKFIATCPHCSFASIAKESLAVRRMCDDLISTDISSLPGTLFTPAGVDSDRGRSIKELIMLSPASQWSNGKGSWHLVIPNGHYIRRQRSITRLAA